ncbi:MAG: hypothetical protein IJJ40_06180 [Clostridia bacterium]|nr:hypothetical protein [Clostridia bacterium]MBR3144634.1 hypothetical protein [Clostridia bacterium]
MNEYFNKIKVRLKNKKVITALCLGGVALIVLSTFIPKSKETREQNESGIEIDEYTNELKGDIEKIVTKITGDKNPTVVVTLESGTRYTYADTKENDTAKSESSSGGQNTEKTKRSYVTVRDSDGAEKALVIAESMPEIRGVAIICEGGDDEYLSAKISGAVTAALNITSKRVYISGGTD